MYRRISFIAVFIVIFMPGMVFSGIEIEQDNYKYKTDAVIFNEEESYLIQAIAPLKKATAPEPVIFKEASIVTEEKVSEKKAYIELDSPKQPEIKKEVILFEINKSNIRPSELEKLEAVAEVAEGFVEIKGYTCPLGTDMYNKKLSKKRAESIGIFLKKHAKKAITVSEEGKPKCCYVSEDKLDLNRRAEIFYYPPLQKNSEEKK